MLDRKFKTKMKIIILLSAITGALSARRPRCHACLDGLCHSRSSVFNAHKFSGQLSVDRKANILYFHYQDNHTMDHTGAFDLNDIKFKAIPKIGFTFGHAVDQTSRDVYMSGTVGIFKYNPTTNAIKSIGLSDKTVWHLQYKNKLYYSEFKKKGVYIYENKKSKLIAPLSNYNIDDFVIDKRNDIYFMSDSIIYRLKNGTKNAEFFIDEIFSLAIDKKGEVNFIQSASRGVYKLDYSKDSLMEVGAFGRGSPFRVVFDADNNMIYHDIDDEKLYYLTPNYSLCSVSTKGKGKHTKKFVAMTKD
ncbi:ommochrome-binding protein-like [Battus philenor]|uniref:ommochrome-binding protein-like n=1 Tax=Battus philenor TaxID=42288 RepID=UPI0035CEB3CD